MTLRLDLGNILEDALEKEKHCKIRCGICGKDLTDAARILGLDGNSRGAILRLHQGVHMDELRTARRDYKRAKDLIFNLERAMHQAVHSTFEGKETISNSWWRKELAKGGVRGRLIASKYDAE